MLIETQRLSKVYGERAVVSDLTLNVGAGEVFGFLGPNGAGKTTSIKMLLGLVRPTAGDGRLMGRALGDPAGRAKVGFLPEHFRFHDWLTGREFLNVHAELYGVPKADARVRIPELLDLVGLTPHARQELRTYSKGMLQRVGLAQAMLPRPALVILDEPTSGLDPVGRRLVRDIIRGLKSEGTAVFLNSHLLSEVEVTCDQVAFIKQGKVVQTSDMASLLRDTLALRVRARPWSADVLAALAPWKPVVDEGSDVVMLFLTTEDEVSEVNRRLVAAGADVLALEPSRRTLEERFIEIVGTEGGL